MMLRVQRERMSGGYFPTPKEYAVTYGLTSGRLARLPALWRHRRAAKRRQPP